MDSIEIIAIGVLTLIIWSIILYYIIAGAVKSAIKEESKLTNKLLML